MRIEKLYLGETMLFFIFTLIVSAIPWVPLNASAQGFGPPSGEMPDLKAEEEDPHRRFRKGSREDMMSEMMRGMRRSPHPESSKKRGHSPLSVQGLQDSLKLDDAQAKKMRSILSEYRKGVIMKTAKLRVSQIELDEMVADRDFVLDDVKKKAKKRESAATALTMARVEALAGARDVLSKEQFGKFMKMLTHQMMARSKKGMHGMRGRRHGRGPHGRASKHGRFSEHGGGRGRTHGNRGDEEYDD